MLEKPLVTVLCSSCQIEITGNFCEQCGRAKKLIRVNGKYIVQEIRSALMLEKGIFYTIKSLLLKPGFSVREYLHYDRNRLVKPILFLLVCSLVYTLSNQIFHFKDAYDSFGNINSKTANLLLNWSNDYSGYTNIVLGIFIALWLRLFFINSIYNFFEILILICFLMGIGMISYTTFGIIEVMTNLPFFQIGALVFIIYTIWAIVRFFDENRFLSYLKALISYILGTFSYIGIIIVIGQVIDSLLNP